MKTQTKKIIGQAMICVPLGTAVAFMFYDNFWVAAKVYGGGGLMCAWLYTSIRLQNSD